MTDEEQQQPLLAESPITAPRNILHGDTRPSATSSAAASTSNVPFPSREIDSAYVLVNMDGTPTSPPPYLWALYTSALADLACTVVITGQIILALRGFPDKEKKELSYRWIGLVVCAVLRALVVIIAASRGAYVRSWNWVVGAACMLSTIYILYEANVLIQSKPDSDTTPIGRSILLLILGFLFSQLHWIVYVLVTSSERRALLFDFENVGQASRPASESGHGQRPANHQQQGAPQYGAVATD